MDGLPHLVTQVILRALVLARPVLMTELLGWAIKIQCPLWRPLPR